MKYKGWKMKKIKRNLLMISIFAVSLILGACSGAGEPAETWEETTVEPATEMMTEETTPAPTEPPTRDLSEIKVGMIFYGEENDGSVLTASLRSELIEAVTALGISEEQIIWQYNSREADWTQIEDSILACVEAGCQVVFGGAREYEAVIAAIAEEYPEVMFSCAGGELMNGTNSGTFDIRPAAAQYLCGVAAAQADTTGHVGFLAAKDTSDENVTAAVNAFAYGVWTVNPGAVVEVGITGKWFLPQAEAAGVAKMQERGCDVVGGDTDSSAGLAAALENGLYVAGYGAEGEGLYGDAYTLQNTGTVLYRFREYFTMKLQQAINREVAGERWIGDYYNGAVVFEIANMEENAAIVVALEQLRTWGPAEEGETAGETAEDSCATEEPIMEESDTEKMPEAEEETETEEETQVEETEPEEIPVIGIDEETGYLANIRFFEIEVPKEEEE